MIMVGVEGIMYDNGTVEGIMYDNGWCGGYYV